MSQLTTLSKLVAYASIKLSNNLKRVSLVTHDLIFFVSFVVFGRQHIQMNDAHLIYLILNGVTSQEVDTRTLTQQDFTHGGCPLLLDGVVV